MMSDTLTSIDTLEIKRGRKLKGRLALPGDAALVLHGLALGALTEGVSRMENFPRTQAALALLDFLGSAGCALDWEEGHLLLTGGRERLRFPDAPFRPSHETELFALGGLFSGLDQRPALSVDPRLVPGSDLAAFCRLFRTDGDGPGAPVDKAGETGLPGESSHAGPGDGEVPSPAERKPADGGESLSAERKLRVLGLAEPVAEGLPGPLQPERWGLDEYLAKTALIYNRLAAGEALHLQLRRPGPDHLENLLAEFQAPLEVKKYDPREMDELSRRIARQMRAGDRPQHPYQLRLASRPALQPPFLRLAGDVTLASVYALAATLLKGSDLVLEDVCLNTSRSVFLQALKRMGADIEVSSRRDKFGEPFGQVRVRASDLFGKRFGAENLEGMRDEIFLLILAAAFAEGETIIRDIAHLRTYGRDLLKALIASLKSVGVEIGEVEDGLVVRGKQDYDAGSHDACGHPVLGAAYYLLGLKSHGTTVLEGAGGMAARFPALPEELARLSE